MNAMFVRFFVFYIILDKKIYPNLLYHAFYCGQPFKQRHRNECYCKKHKEYQPIKSKDLICCDCHKPFKVDGIVKNKKRCDECQKILRDKQNKEKSSKYYYNHK